MELKNYRLLLKKLQKILKSEDELSNDHRALGDGRHEEALGCGVEDGGDLVLEPVLVVLALGVLRGTVEDVVARGVRIMHLDGHLTSHILKLNQIIIIIVLGPFTILLVSYAKYGIECAISNDFC